MSTIERQMNELTGRELDVALVRAMGWTPLEFEVPRYHESVDDLIRDVLPKCWERGMSRWSIVGVEGHVWGLIVLDWTLEHGVDADTPALALARACLSALEARP